VSIWNKHLCNLFGGGKSRSPKQGEFRYPICGDIVPVRELLAHAVADDERFRDGRVIARIKQDHPVWVEADGACPKCVEHYRQALSVEKIKPRPRDDRV
jgi:hypothetical protein